MFDAVTPTFSEGCGLAGTVSLVFVGQLWLCYVCLRLGPRMCVCVCFVVCSLVALLFWNNKSTVALHLVKSWMLIWTFRQVEHSGRGYMSYYYAFNLILCCARLFFLTPVERQFYWNRLWEHAEHRRYLCDTGDELFVCKMYEFLVNSMFERGYGNLALCSARMSSCETKSSVWATWHSRPSRYNVVEKRLLDNVLFHYIGSKYIIGSMDNVWKRC